MRAFVRLTWAYERQREHRAIRGFSCHVVRIFCEVMLMSHTAINRSVDKVSALRGSIDTRESITNSFQGDEETTSPWLFTDIVVALLVTTVSSLGMC